MSPKAKEAPSSTDAPVQQPLHDVDTSTAVTSVQTMEDLFARPTNALRPVKAIHFKRTLTKELVAMAHREEMLFTVTSDMYTIDLPTQGRSVSYQPARVIDVLDLEQNREVMLICNEMMVSAFKRGGYSVIEMGTGADSDKVTTSTHLGASLIGHSFGCRAGDIKDDKNYRVVDVVEIELER